MGMYDDVLAAKRNEVGVNAANMAGSGSVFLAAKGGERMRQGVNSMFGIEEPEVIAAKSAEARNVKLQGIVSKYANASTRADFTKAFSELMANDFPEHAAKIQEHLKNMPKPVESTADIKNFNKAVEQGYPGSFFEYQKALKSGSKQVNIGSVPQDFIIATNELGEITMEVIPGSPTDKANKKAEEVKGEGAARKAIQSSVVIEDIGRLTDAIKNDSFLDPASSSILAYIMENPLIGSGKNRIDAVSLATTIKSSIGFDRLQQMREESPTGGALGQVSELELVTLQATLGSLDLNQSKENILYNLERLEEIYINIFTKLQAYPNFEKYFGESVVSDSPEEIVKNDDPLGIR
jgi:hypothetical protein